MNCSITREFATHEFDKFSTVLSFCFQFLIFNLFVLLALDTVNFNFVLIYNLIFNYRDKWKVLNSSFKKFVANVFYNMKSLYFLQEDYCFIKGEY